MNKQSKNSATHNGYLWGTALLVTVLAAIFWRSFLPDYIHFSNDGPLGQENWDWLKQPSALFGMWDDANDVGFSAGAASPSITAMLPYFLGPVGYAKFLAPIALLIVGLGALMFFRQLKFSLAATFIGALAAVLNSTFFEDACWGTASHQIALGMDFFALALILANDNETRVQVRWTRVALAGLCVGINVIEAADVGALYSLFIAAFIFYKTLVDEGGNFAMKTARGVGRVAVVAIFAGFIAIQTITALVGSQIQGIAGTGQDTETKAANWDKATQWSLPKIETFNLFIPGIFGYKMDTPNNMMPAFQDAYRNGAYWGGIGRDPANDRFFDGGGQGNPPSSWMRFTGGTNYCGILVALIAAWTIAQSFRRQNSPFSPNQKKFIWFWTVVLAVSLPIAWGRFAPLFYGTLYHLPYFSTIRNPCKFLFFFSWAMVILFAYGINALTRLANLAPAKNSGLTTQLQGWWKKAAGFDRKLIFVCAGIFAASVLGWLIYASQKASLVKYIQKVGFPDEDLAGQLAAFSITQVGWFLVLFAIAIILVTLFLAGYFTGARAKIGAWLLGAFLVFDLVRADLPYVIHWDYKQKYEVGSLNPIEDFLRDKPYEHRVAKLPFDAQSQLRLDDNYFGGRGGIYSIEWSQQHFPYYNIQSLDIIQLPRVPEDIMAYWQTFVPQSVAEYPVIARHWQLTNTRYLLGAAGFLNVLNTQLDPGKERFRIAQRFDIVAKPGIQPTSLEELTATPSADGDLALFDFTGALPRAKLYSNWQVNTNDQANLKTLADLNFDPVKTVLISTPENDLPVVATNENSGSVEYKSYASKDIVFDAKAVAPSVLLLNDKYDPHWKVTVDGKPAQLLRCNFLMRGVYLQPGDHTVEFHFSLPSGPLYVTFAGIIVGLVLCGLLFFWTRRQQAV